MMSALGLFGPCPKVVTESDIRCTPKADERTGEVFFGGGGLHQYKNFADVICTCLPKREICTPRYMASYSPNVFFGSYMVQSDSKCVLSKFFLPKTKFTNLDNLEGVFFLHENF